MSSPSPSPRPVATDTFDILGDDLVLQTDDNGVVTTLFGDEEEDDITTASPAPARVQVAQRDPSLPWWRQPEWNIE